MNVFGAVVTGLLLAASQLSVGFEQQVARVQHGLAGPLSSLSEHVSALKQQLRRSGSSLDEQPSTFTSVPTRGRTIMIPAECHFQNQRYDLYIHFHGANATVEPIFERAGINAVFTILNWGIGSGAYEDRFSDPGALDHMLAAVREEVRDKCQNPELDLGRLAIGGWSAGYGAVGKILGREADAQRVDSVLLADGLHAGYEPGKPSELNSLQMEPFALFSYEAAAGEKLMAITHSAIVPPGYASTTQTADYLLRAQGLARKTTRVPMTRPGMVLSSHAEQGNFFVRGFDGGDAPAHCHHLYAFGETLLPLLRSRWMSR